MHRIRLAFVCSVMVAGCSSKSDSSAVHSGPPAPASGRTVPPADRVQVAARALAHLDIPEVRFVDAVAAPAKQSPPLVMIDAKGAVTVAYVDDDGLGLSRAAPHRVPSDEALDPDSADIAYAAIRTGFRAGSRGADTVQDLGRHLKLLANPLYLGADEDAPATSGDGIVDGSGEIVRDLSSRQPAVVLANPHAPADAIVSAVQRSGGGVIGVNHGGEVRALRIRFAGDGTSAPTPARPHATLTIEPSRIMIGTSSVAWTNGVLDVDAVAKAVGTWTQSADSAIDISLAPGVDAKHLVDVLAALEVAGVKAIGLRHH